MGFFNTFLETIACTALLHIQYSNLNERNYDFLTSWFKKQIAWDESLQLHYAFLCKMMGWPKTVC